jgi:hypothetical protein
LEAEIKKLKTVNDAKNKEIESLHGQIEDLRATKFKEIQNYETVIAELKEKLLNLRQDH